MKLPTMKLNLPIDLTNRTILLAGAGGGWDIFGGLPLLYEWRETCKIVLANFLARVEGFDVRLVTAADDPEGKLADALNLPVYVFGKAGFRTLKTGYEMLVKEHGIDTIILADGGVDSLMRGDEEGCGTIFQDTLSVGVVDSLNVPTKILACVGFGTETEEGVCHYRALENIAAITKDGGFLGACALTANMEAFGFYEDIRCKVAVKRNPRATSTAASFPPSTGSSGSTAMFSIFCRTCRRSCRPWHPSSGSSMWLPWPVETS